MDKGLLEHSLRTSYLFPSSLSPLTSYLSYSYCCLQKNPHTLVYGFGAPSGIRTRDTLIKSQVLYQLS